MSFLEEIIAVKNKEVASMQIEEIKKIKKRPSFYQFLKEHPQHMQLIAEIKRASPSKGAIATDIDPLSQAKLYEKAGAGAISVLTDEQFFKGSITDLQRVAEVVNVPLLCKDFIISKKQLIRASNAGASIVLLIVAALSVKQLTELYQAAEELGLEVLVEVHDLAELKIAENLGAKLIGVNNRNLKTFEVSIAVSEIFAKELSLKDSTCYISESGFKEKADVQRVAKDYQAVLVGEALMREQSPEQAARNLRIKR